MDRNILDDAGQISALAACQGKTISSRHAVLRAQRQIRDFRNSDQSRTEYGQQDNYDCPQFEDIGRKLDIQAAIARLPYGQRILVESFVRNGYRSGLRTGPGYQAARKLLKAGLASLAVSLSEYKGAGR